MKDMVDTNGLTLPGIECPDTEQLRAYGDVLFLAFRSARHSQMAVGQLRHYFEPALRLGQFRIFRFDGVARGMFTWGWLSEDAERRLILGETLQPEDWNSGKRLWIIDIIAPYQGLTHSMVRWIMQPGHFTDGRFFFRRIDGSNQTRRIVCVDMYGERLAKVYSESAFLKTCASDTQSA